MDWTENAVCIQAKIMNCEVFEIGLFQQGAKQAMVPRVWDQGTLLSSVGWLKRENMGGRNIFIRPNGEHELTLVDDLNIDGVEAMKQTGFEPALVVETSPRNFQAWLRHPEKLPKELGTACARSLAARFGGDTGAADWRHFGRLAGFTNRKEKYLDPVAGLYPFVRIVEASGKVYSEAGKFLATTKAQLEKEAEERRDTAARWANTSRKPLADPKPIEAFRGDTKYCGDNTRIDLAYALYALAHGTSAEQVTASLRSRDLSHKGNERRQNEYVERTIRKALHAIEGIGRE